ncbi:transcriptional regulator, CarD family [Lachnospiraceae bacterium C7]|nr:transcriptional regulator, CarD family [Lachnospiraceae bacterium C7]
MFEIGEFVVNANNGICRVEDIVHLDMSAASKKKKYYLLIPIEEKTAKVYIPVDNNNHKIREVMNEDQAWEVIERIPTVEKLEVLSDKQREQKYKEAIQSCNPEKLIAMIKNVHERTQKRNALGKKTTAIDERYFKQAENNLFTELAFALGRDKQEMRGIIADRLESVAQ